MDMSESRKCWGCPKTPSSHFVEGIRFRHMIRASRQKARARNAGRRLTAAVASARMPAAPRGGTLIGSIPTGKDKPALSVSTVRSRLWATRHRTRNTAAMPAILRRDMARGVKAVDDRAFSYISAMAAARKMRDSGILTDKDYLTVEEAMREKYGVPKGSIYRDFDLLCPNFRAIMSHHKEVAECP